MAQAMSFSEKGEKMELSQLKIPTHVSIIMDGNGRWAKSKGMPRTYGHSKGADVLMDICEDADALGIKYLTVYAFSTENWSRPETEVKTLMFLFRKYIKICKPIRFDGNGYSDEWKAEAERRGLDCETSCPVIFDNYLSADSIAMFGSTGVMTQVELEARNEVKWETYTKKIQIEARVLGDLAMNHIVPVAIEYQSKLIDNVYKMKGLFSAEEAGRLSAENLAIIREISERTAYIKEHVDAMVEARKVANKIEGERAKAVAYHDTIAPMLEQIRYHIDKLELIVDDQMWTLPKYRELLFIR